MTPQTFIFFGPSGCGKGTQVNLLQEEIKKKDPERKILYLETGQRFRNFIKETSLSSKLTKEILDVGGLVPEFLPIWLWTDFLVQNFSGEEHLFFDGSPRKPEEAKILDSAIRFYKIKNPTVISIEVSDEWAIKLMKGRGRSDDNEEEMKNRLGWFKDNVVPAIEYFKNDPDYKFITIDGEHTIEEVHGELMEKVGL
jgi:adenylate kinase